MIITEEENLVLANGSAEGGAELVLVECAARVRKIISRIEIRVAKKLENVAVKSVRPGLGYHIDLAAAKFSVLGVEIIRENAEFGDGIEVRNNRGAHVDVFFDIAAVDDETVGKFALPVNRDGAGI